MIAARQELDLRPQLERLDAVVLCAAGIDPGTMRFSFRPLWQLTAPERAAVALQKAQATAVYAGLQLWPAAVTAGLVRSQLLEDGTYPGAAAVFGAGEGEAAPDATDPDGKQRQVVDFDPDQARASNGRWTSGGGGAPGEVTPPGMPVAAKVQPQANPMRAASAPNFASEGGSSGEGGVLGRTVAALNPTSSASAQEIEPEEESREEREETAPLPESRLRDYTDALQSLQEVAPNDPALTRLSAPVTESEVAGVEAALRQAVYERTYDFIMPNGRPIGQEGGKERTRSMPGQGLLRRKRLMKI